MTRSLHTRTLRRTAFVVTLVVAVGSLSGCSLFVMAGKMFFGDPKVPSMFSAQTGVDLTEGEHELLVICETPHLVRSKMPTFQYDLTEGVLRRLKQNEVNVVSADKVSKWIDKNGGEFSDPSDLAEDFKVDYIGVVNFDQVRFFEENSQDMFRGFASGSLRVYEVREVGDQRQAMQVFSGEFSTEYPRFRPVSIHEMSERVFQKQFVSHLSQHVARQFHDYRMGDDF
jgi:hypothetical protein